MKRLHYAIVSLLLSGSLMTVGCSSNDEISAVNQQEQMLQISADILNTRGIKEGSSFAEGDTIGLVLTGNGIGVDVNHYAVYNGYTWKLNNNIDLSLIDGSIAVSAYYPYHHDGIIGLEKYGDGYVLKMHPTETDYLKTTEEVKVNWKEPVASLSFQHLMSRVTLYVKNAKEYAGVCALDSSYIYPVRSEATVAMQGNLADKDNGEFKTLGKAHNGTIIPTGNAIVADYIVIPQNTKDCKVRLKIDGEYYEVTFPEQTLLAGYHYKFNINVKYMKIPYLEISAGQITPWSANENSNFALEDKVEKVTVDGYEYVDLGLPSGTLWAAYNVGAKRPQEYGYYYAWGETATKMSYSWTNYLNGKMQSWNDCATEADPMKNVHYIGGMAEYDAATASWGKNWRMPTMDELLELISVAEIEPANLNGVAGYTFTCKDKSLFFPSAGYYDNDDVKDMGHVVKLWACTQEYTDDSGKPNYSKADILTVKAKDSTCPEGYSWGHEYRCFGLSIRPVVNQ